MMKFEPDPRMKVARRALLLSWLFYAVFVLAVIVLGSSLGIEPQILGLPAWAAVSVVFVPIVFVIFLVFLIGKIIPDIPLTDESIERDKK
ncbi:MAG: DUF997 family protein [Candidatus Aminicenantes bacterium]|nr:DUF997 family protein [Candidatus Aminicenantes bacterium]